MKNLVESLIEWLHAERKPEGNPLLQYCVVRNNGDINGRPVK